MRNFSIERLMQELVRKNILSEQRELLLSELFAEFPYQPTLKDQRVFLKNIENNDNDQDTPTRSLDQKIDAERVEKAKRDKAATGAVDTTVIVEGILFDFKVRDMPETEQIICKKIYLFILQNS